MWLAADCTSFWPYCLDTCNSPNFLHTMLNHFSIAQQPSSRPIVSFRLDWRFAGMEIHQIPACDDRTRLISVALFLCDDKIEILQNQTDDRCMRFKTRTPQHWSTQILISLRTITKLRRGIIGMTASFGIEHADTQMYTFHLYIVKTWTQRGVVPLGRCGESVELPGYGFFGITWWLDRRAKFWNLRTRQCQSSDT